MTPIFGVRSDGVDNPLDVDEALGVLLAAGASLETRSSYGDTPLVSAAREGDLYAVRALLKAGADADARGHQNQTALAAAQAEREVRSNGRREGWLRSLLWEVSEEFRQRGEAESLKYDEIEILLTEYSGDE